MAQLHPQYRVTLFAPQAVDPTETTPFTPAANAYHADAFKVATISGVSGFQPYLDFPQGRKGQYDPTTGKLTVGSLSFRILDRRNSSASNLQRWVTAFFGDITGKSVFASLRAIVEESTDGGTTWTPFFAGRIADVQLNDPLWYSLTIREATDELNSQIFIAQPAYGTQGTALTSLVPMGLTARYGPFSATTWFSGKVSANSTGTKTITLDNASQNSTFNHYTAVLDKLASQYSFKDVLGLHVVSTAQFSSELAGYYRVFVSGSGAISQYTLKSMLLGNPGSGDNRFTGKVWNFEIQEVATTDPYYASLSALTNGSTYSVRLAAAYQTISADTPLFISGQHPVSLFRDICLGQYGRINSKTGLPIKAMPIDVTAFNTLISDTSYDIPRFKITQQYTVVDFFEKHLAPFGIGYRIEPQTSGSTIVGAIVPFDARFPKTFAGLPTITDTDLADFLGGWQLGKPLSAITVKSYIEQSVSTFDQDTKPFLINETDYTTYEIIDGTTPANGTTLSIDALGVRSPIDSSSAGGFGTNFTTGTQLSPLQKMVANYSNRFGNGAATATLNCRRTSTVNGLKVGQWCLVTVSLLPDQTTHLRGGTRLMQVIERSESGINVTLKFMDGGRNVFTVAPTVGTISGATNYPTTGIIVPITTYSGSQRIQIDIANEPIGSAQPAIGSSDWQTWRFQASSTGYVPYEILNLAGGRRYYVRARTSTVTGELPSAWVSASTPYYDLPTIAAPTGLGYSNLTPVSVDLSWGNGGDSGSQVIVSVAAPSGSTLQPVAQLIPGTTRYHLNGLTSASAYQPFLVSVAHYDPAGGQSVAAYTTFTVTGTMPVCPDSPGRIFENADGVTTYTTGPSREVGGGLNNRLGGPHVAV